MAAIVSLLHEIGSVWNGFRTACVQNGMGTMTIPMTTMGRPTTGWIKSAGTRAKVVKIDAVRRASSVPQGDPTENRTIAQPVSLGATGGEELPVVRDNRGTLLPPHGEELLLRTADESADREPWRAEAAAAPVMDAAKAAEIDALHRLVYACMQGNGAAWQQLVVSQHRRVYGICYRFTGSPTDAEDLTQDVFLKVYRNMSGFDPAKGAFTTWLTTLTRNLLVDHFRRTRQDRATDSLDESSREGEDGPTMADRLADTRPNQMQQVAQQELRVRIQHALKQLSPELREAVILRDLQDMDYKEIAAVLKVPEGTVKSRISRGRAEMARMLGRTEGKVM
jgi:RNA polymerase sigma-70 factor (ECF subfamily)